MEVTECEDQLKKREHFMVCFFQYRKRPITGKKKKQKSKRGFKRKKGIIGNSLSEMLQKRLLHLKQKKLNGQRIMNR
jgi:hypothetical protein